MPCLLEMNERASSCLNNDEAYKSVLWLYSPIPGFHQANVWIMVTLIWAWPSFFTPGVIWWSVKRKPKGEIRLIFATHFGFSRRRGRSRCRRCPAKKQLFKAKREEHKLMSERSISFSPLCHHCRSPLRYFSYNFSVAIDRLLLADSHSSVSEGHVFSDARSQSLSLFPFLQSWNFLLVVWLRNRAYRYWMLLF